MTSLSAPHRRYVARETAVSVAISSLLSLGFALLAAHGAVRLPLWGPGGMALDFIPQTFMIALATTLAVTLLTRKRLRRGAAPSLPAGAGGPLARTPRPVLLRALTVAAGASVLFTPLAVAALHLLGSSSLAVGPFILVKVLYGAAVSLLIAPLIVRAALADAS